jgi:hypothetical protein
VRRHTVKQRHGAHGKAPSESAAWRFDSAVPIFTCGAICTSSIRRHRPLGISLTPPFRSRCHKKVRSPPWNFLPPPPFLCRQLPRGGASTMLVSGVCWQRNSRETDPSHCSPSHSTPSRICGMQGDLPCTCRDSRPPWQSRPANLGRRSSSPPCCPCSRTTSMSPRTPPTV